MIYLFINIPNAEMMQLENKLPKGSYCFLQVQGGSSRYYGLIKKDAYPILLSSLSPETRQNIELLDKDVFQAFLLQNIGDQVFFTGNRRLISYLSDELG